MIRRPPRSTLSSSSAASDVYKRQVRRLCVLVLQGLRTRRRPVARRRPQEMGAGVSAADHRRTGAPTDLSLIHISEPTRLLRISYAVFCLKKKKTKTHKPT